MILPIPENAIPLTDTERKRIAAYRFQIDRLEREKQMIGTALVDICLTVVERSGNNPDLNWQLSADQRCLIPESKE